MEKIFVIWLFLTVGIAHAVPPDAVFTSLASENGIIVETASRKEGPPWVRATGQIEFSVDRIAQILSDFSHYSQVFEECYAKADVLEASLNSARLHVVWRYPIFFRNRDAIVRYEFRKESGKAFRLEWRSDPKPGDPSEGIRLQQAEGSVEVTSQGVNHSRLIYIYIGDLGGDFSQTVKEAAWKRQPEHYFRALSRAAKP